MYDSAKVEEIVDWIAAVNQRDDIHTRLLTLDSINKYTNDDGTYEVYVIPGTVDIMIDKAGYLDEIYVKKEINEGDVIELGEVELLAGDINKDGQIQLLDASLLVKLYGTVITDSDYNINYDFNEDEQIQLMDSSWIVKNYGMVRNINF